LDVTSMFRIAAMFEFIKLPTWFHTSLCSYVYHLSTSVTGLTKLQFCIQYFHQVDCWRKYTPGSHDVILHSTRILPEQKFHIFPTTTDMHHSTTWNIPKRFEPPSRFKISPVRVASISDGRTLVQNLGDLA